jgi:deazaflavin-dependent oxidoreductase (nitroreductase family)
MESHSDTSIKNERKYMAATSPVPRFVRVANVLTKTLLRAGVNLVGFGRHPTYLLTVRGRKSGELRTTPVSVVERDGKRYLFAPYGVVNWVRNLRAAGAATLTRGRRAEAIRAIELPNDEAGLVLKAFIESGNPMGRYFGVTMESSREEFERTTIGHPVFLLQSVDAAISGAAGQIRPVR